MSELFKQMRDGISNRRFGREFVLLSRSWAFNADPNDPALLYYFEDHPDLRQKIRVLENNGLVQHLAGSNVDRFLMSEELVDYLRSGE
jgi:hypothetical protein